MRKPKLDYVYVPGKGFEKIDSSIITNAKPVSQSGNPTSTNITVRESGNTRLSKIEIETPNVYDIHNPVNSSVRVGSARKTDFHHDFSNIIDNYASEAHSFDIIRKDGKIIKLYQIEGGLGHKNGIFEWIVDENKVIHRLFIENGQINGLPNQKLRK